MFPFEIPMKKYILTNQMKNEYFQENEKKRINSQGTWYFLMIQMKLSKEKVKPKGNDFNLKVENAWESQGKWHFLTMKVQKWSLFSFTKDIGSKTEHESFQNHEDNDIFSQMKRKYWGKWSKCTSKMRS